MNKRLFIITILGLLVFGGLVSGVYASAIQRALTVPRTNTATRQTGMNPAPMAPSAKASSPTAQKQQPGQGQGQNQANGANGANVLAEDTFQRKDQPQWGTASDNHSWDGDANTKPVFSITGTSGQISKGQGSFDAVLGPNKDNVDVTAGEQINNFDNGVNIGVVLRWTDANNWYKVLLDGTHITLLKRVNGQTTTIVSKPFEAQANLTYMLRMQAIGSMLFAKAWPSNTPEPNTWAIVKSDNDLASGQAGIRVVLGPATVISVMSFKVVTASMANTL